MKFGVREICEVVLKAKATQKIGNKIFYANEPVLYFDTLKTSSMEGAATTVYAQGGRGNSRLVAWEGERTVTFTMEDALISPEGFMILSGAGLIEAAEDAPIYQHITETIDAGDVEINDDGISFRVKISETPYLPTDKNENFAYVMFKKNGEIISEPYIPGGEGAVSEDEEGNIWLVVQPHETYQLFDEPETMYEIEGANANDKHPIPTGVAFDSVLVDYYTERTGYAKQIEITADKFGGNYYLEASTLFRDQNGVDMPAEFIIPNCKIQSNFTFTMASTGDPSTFTFTMDAFPDYTRFDHSKKVLCAIQIIQDGSSQNLYRTRTWHAEEHEALLKG